MNITKETESYVLSHASVKDALKKGLINYSKLSRKIMLEKGLKRKDFDAVVVALRRHEHKLKTRAEYERNILALLKQTALEIKNKILVCIIEKSTYYKHIIYFHKDIKEHRGETNIVEGSNAITIIVSQKYEQIIDKYFRNSIIKKKRDLIAIMLKSPESLEHTPGVVGYLYSLFAEYEINIVETTSCWTDTIFIIEEKDLDESMRLLRFN